MLRALHGSPAMSLEDSMTASAQAWATKIAGMGKLEHSKSGSPDNPEKDGENIAYMCLMPGEEYPGQRPVKMWYVYLNFSFTVFGLLEDRVLHKEAWVAKLLGTHLSIQVHKRPNFQEEISSFLAVKGLTGRKKYL